MSELAKNTAICLTFTYHFADLDIFKKEKASQRKAFALLKKEGINPEDGDAVSKAYTELVEDMAGDILPDSWETTFDYWGGKCFAKKPGWNAPKSNTLMAGESYGYLCCTSPEAIQEELKKFAALEEEAFV